jgi:hypothetical protein
MATGHHVWRINPNGRYELALAAFRRFDRDTPIDYLRD